MKFSQWLRRKLLGCELDEFCRVQRQVIEITNSQVADILENQRILNKAIKNLQNRVPSTGWINLVQNAIAKLDDRIDNVIEGYQYHQELLESFQKDKLEVINLTSDEKEVN